MSYIFIGSDRSGQGARAQVSSVRPNRLAANAQGCGMDPQLPELPTVSLICPAFEEEEVISLFHEELFRVLRALERDYRFEIIYIDDGSRDGTLARMNAIAQLDPGVPGLGLARTLG